MSLTELQYRAEAAAGSGAQRGIEGRSQWRLTWQRLRHDRAAVISAAVILVITAMAIAAPGFAALTGHAADQQFINTGISSTGAPVGPGKTFWLGADELGRDLFIRILYGARISLFVGVVTTAIGTVAGLAVGLASGYFGGWIDMALSRFVDTVLAFPYVVLALALAAVFGPSLPILIAVISFFSWSGIARVVRGQTISIKERDYITAARALGASPLRIMVIDIMPNLLGPVLVLATLSIPSAIVFEATLSFLGIGVQLPTPSWGNILNGAQNYYAEAWWYLVFPALALLVTTLAFNLLGDGIRDALDPSAERLISANLGGRRRRRRRRSARSAAAVPAASGAGRPDLTAAGPPGSRAGSVAVDSRPSAGDELAVRYPHLGRRIARTLGGQTGAVIRFLIRRVIGGILVLWVVSLATFLLFFTRPAISVARSLAGKEPTAVELKLITKQLGLNQPTTLQYWHFVDRLLHGNLGYSYSSGEPVSTIIAQDLPRTASVVIGAVALWLLAGLAVGVLSATRARSLFDRIATIGVLGGLSMPVFVLGQLLLFGVFLQLNKHGITWIQDGYEGPSQSISGWIGHMILPWITLATASAAVYSRLSRGSLLDTLSEDYIRTARSKGMSERRVILRHALRSALTPLVSQLGIDVGTLLGGVVVTETVFSIGGLGQDSVAAIYQGNLPLIIGFVLVAAVFVVGANLIVDLCYTLLDPRVRIS